MFWTSNRPNNFGPAPTIQDTPWALFCSQLNAVSTDLGPLGPFQDWLFEIVNNSPTRWWNPLPAAAQYPDVTKPTALFPSQKSDVVGDPNTPVVPGRVVQNAAGQAVVRFASPALAQDDMVLSPNPPFWLFMQGSAYKNAPGGEQSSTLDARTFYVPVVLRNGSFQPDTTANNGVPYSFLNDPVLQKFGPRPMVLNGTGFLFWYGGAQGRTRLYYNVNRAGLTNVSGWSADAALPTPGGLQGLADPYPVVRHLDQGNPVAVTDIDVIYTGTFRNRTQPETLLTRYSVAELQAGRPARAVRLLPRVDHELLGREGASQTWAARDVAWLTRDPVTSAYVDGTGNSPYIIVNVNGTRANTGAPTFDNATGRLYFDSTLRGRLYVDPQSGTVTFPDVAPRISDSVTATYTPQTMRLNVTRDESGVVTVPNGWGGDAAFAPRPQVAAPGANTGPVAVLDRAINPRTVSELDVMRAGSQAGVPATTSRLWVFYRKTGSNVTSPAALYYKAMRLMVRLPRTPLRSVANGQYTVGNNVQVSGNVGPVEIDWMRGRLYFTEADEGSVVSVSVTYDANQPPVVADYRVTWGDELSAAEKPGDQTTGESVLPTDAAVNEGQISAFKDPYQDKVWLFWTSTRSGTSDLFYMAISPAFYPQVAPQ